MSDAQLTEIFSSIQGEGLYVGERQVFVRFSGCNLSCGYCDTPQAISINKEYKIEATPGQHDFKMHLNPCTADELVAHVNSLCHPKKAVHSVCLTGGEPLLQVDFLKAFLPKLKSDQLKIFLETNGTLPKHLEEIIDLVDIVAMDIKIPSASESAFSMKENLQFLEVAYTKEVFVKIVVVAETNAKEIDDAAKLIASVDDNIPLIIQPVTPTSKVKHKPQGAQLLALQAVAKRTLNNVRVIPQVHKMLGVL